MASNYDNYSHEELIRKLLLRDRRIDLLKQELLTILPTAQPVENSDDSQKCAKKTLTSVNENVSSGNSRLNVKTPELTCRMEDMSNLLASTGIATLFVDQQLHILCFTPAIIPLIKLTPGVIGQPLGSIVFNLGQYGCLEEDIQTVLDTQGTPRIRTANHSRLLASIAYYPLSHTAQYNRRGSDYLCRYHPEETGGRKTTT